MEIMTDTDTTPSPEGVEKLNTLVTLERLRTVLTNPSQGWRSGALWDDQDAPYKGQGPVCMAGGVTIAIGRTDLHMGRLHELDAAIDFHPAIVALDRTIATLYPHFGSAMFPLSWDTQSPGDHVAAWNDATGRTLSEVLAVVDATIARVGSE